NNSNNNKPSGAASATRAASAVASAPAPGTAAPGGTARPATAAAATPAGAASQAANLSPIKIGVMADLASTTAIEGAEMRINTDLAVQMINSSGGINGH